MTSEPEQWGVLVDEVGIFATGRGSDWWALYSTRMQASGVLITLDVAFIAGALYLMRCEDREAAEFAAEYMGQHVWPKFAKATTLARAQKSIRIQHANRRGHGVCEYCRPDAPTAAAA
jgi:hypothetical protein